jgi:hypothetical protein
MLMPRLRWLRFGEDVMLMPRLRWLRFGEDVMLRPRLFVSSVELKM